MCSAATGGPQSPTTAALSLPDTRSKGSSRAGSATSLWWPGPLEGDRGQLGGPQRAAVVARGGAEATLGLKPDTRRGSGGAARPPPLPPARPAIRGGNARREAWWTTPARRPDPALRRAPGPAEATPATHLRSDGKPVAKKNVQRDYRTFIPFSPTLGKRAEPAHDTTFPVCPAPAPRAPLSAPFPHRRGPWACALRPPRVRSALGACSSRRAGRAQRFRAGRTARI